MSLRHQVPGGRAEADNDPGDRTHLERKGLIAREPDPDPYNRRVLRIRLTEEGERMVRDCDRWMDGIEARRLAGLPAAEKRTLRATLAACERNLRPPDQGRGRGPRPT